MAISLTISDSVETVTIGATDAYLRSIDIGRGMADAEWVSATIEADFFGGNATVDANLAELDRLFGKARARQQARRGNRVYLTLTIDSDVWRSEVLDGEYQSGPDWLRYERANGTRQVMISVTRANYFEDATERQISLTNTNGTDNTAGLNVYNCNDGSGSSPNDRVNYVEITAAKVAGDLPAPAILTMNDFCPNSGDQLTDIWIAHNWRSDPANFVHLYDLSGSADASQSGGAMLDTAFGSGEAYVYATLTAAQFARMHGQRFRLLARMALGANMDTAIFHPAVDFRATSLSSASLFGNPVYGSQLAKYQMASAPGPLIDLGLLPPIPSIEVPGLTYGNGAIGFRVQEPSAARIYTDYLYLLPVDSFRRIDAGGGVNSDYVLNELENTCYRIDASGNWYGTDTMRGTPITLQPNTLQRILFGWNYIPVTPGTYTDAVITDLITVKLYYRPRRRTL